eukprot:2986559-Karenia_brevis.AAC.1
MSNLVSDEVPAGEVLLRLSQRLEVEAAEEDDTARTVALIETLVRRLHDQFDSPSKSSRSAAIPTDKDSQAFLKLRKALEHQ